MRERGQLAGFRIQNSRKYTIVYMYMSCGDWTSSERERTVRLSTTQKCYSKQEEKKKKKQKHVTPAGLLNPGIV